MSATGTKPFNGMISKWQRRRCLGGLGYCITGWGTDHPTLPDADIRTSEVLAHDETTGEIETKNSRYRLVGPSRDF